MDDFEQRLSDNLVDAVPEPLHEVRLATVRELARPRYATAASRLRRARARRDTTRRPRQPRLAIAGAVLAVILVVAAAVAIARVTRPQGSAAPAVSTLQPQPPGTSTDLAALAAPRWRVTGLPDSSRLVFTFRDGAAGDNADDATEAHITRGRIRFGTWINGAVAGRDFPHSDRIYSILAGPMSWYITGHLVTMSGAHGSVEFRRVMRGASKPASQPTFTRTRIVSAAPATPAPPNSTTFDEAQGCASVLHRRIHTITLLPDAVAPTCAKVGGQQRVEIVNDVDPAHGGPARAAHLAGGGLPRVIIPAGRAVLFARPVGDYLARGQHVIRFAAGHRRFDIWVR